MVRSISGLAVMLLSAAAGCAEPASALTGYVNVPLIASGPDGVSYRLPLGTELGMIRDGALDFHALDAETQSVTVVVPTGDYQVFLIDPAGDTAIWPLTRTQPDGTTETVQAVLDPLPVVTVTESQTTSLVIRFRVPVIGPIAFTTGTVEVSIDVVETETTSIDVVIAAPSLTVQSASLGDLAPAQLGARLPSVNSSGDGETVTIHTDGPWRTGAGDVVCAPVVITVGAMGRAAFVNLAAEVPPQGNELMCIIRGGVGQNRTLIEVGLEREGPALTPLLSDLGDREFAIQHVVSFFIEEDLFDGSRVALDRIAGTQTAELDVNAVVFEMVGTPAEGIDFNFWADVFETGNGTLTVTPR